MKSPAKHDLFGVLVSATSYEEALEVVIGAAKRGRKLTVDHMPVHGLVEAARDPVLRECINSFDIVAPDGHPVRWALNRLRGTRLADRVYGPELMLRLCGRAAEDGVGVYLYGSTEDVVGRLRESLLKRFPGLRVVGSESPPFRPLTPKEDQEMVERINQSSAGLVFVGLGCPKQEIFAHEHRDQIHAAQLCVGAAFDFLAGQKRMAPSWMQDRGLEWLFRLVSEPRRLWRRYLVTNTIFLAWFGQELARGRGSNHSNGASTEERSHPRKGTTI